MKNYYTNCTPDTLKKICEFTINELFKGENYEIFYVHSLKLQDYYLLVLLI